MGKQKKENKKQTSLKSNLDKLPSAKKSTIEEPAESENLFDFGGLPMRDLKKNLGCG
ncbi:MAG: hypothetical protein ACKO96_03795 [Flammeovirgaceae bacterium]